MEEIVKKGCKHQRRNGECRRVLTQEEMIEEVREGKLVRRYSITNQPFLSKIVREIAEKNNATQPEVASVIGKDVRILRNKLYKGVFSLQDIVLIGDMFGFKVTVSDGETEYTIEPEDVCDSESIERLKEYHNKKKEAVMEQLEFTSDEAILEYIKSNPERLKAYAEQLSKHKKND